jgi:transposase InsO family protein
MPWEERSTMDSRRLFIEAASQEGANRRALCRQFGISPTTGYTWLARAAQEGVSALADRSRRPRTSPCQTPPAIEDAVLAAQQQHPSFGPRKLRAWLERQGTITPVPAASTMLAILRRHGVMPPAMPPLPEPLSFERAAPNELWQLDFMGHRPLATGRVHPLSLLDDHSRFALCLAACPHERGALVRSLLLARFQDVGLPAEILTDNGPPWGMVGRPGISALEAWLLRYGIAVHHGRVRHPQTQGKIERWHRTVGEAVFARQELPDLAAAQTAFDAFRQEYNYERPHEALLFHTPAERYQPSLRPCPTQEPVMTYDDGEVTRIVSNKGVISFQNRHRYVGEGLRHERVAIRPTSVDGVLAIVYGPKQITTIDLTEPVR